MISSSLFSLGGELTIQATEFFFFTGTVLLEYLALPGEDRPDLLQLLQERFLLLLRQLDFSFYGCFGPIYGGPRRTDTGATSTDTLGTPRVGARHDETQTQLRTTVLAGGLGQVILSLDAGGTKFAFL
uniref:Uncharacterized protein n=1 Tax=Passalora fulva TaxID=5499 RepID=A0A9Q8L896_PASFU